MEPSEVLKFLRQYLRHPRETRKQIKFWLQTRHPKYGWSNGSILFWTVAGFLAFLLFSFCWPTGNYQFLLVPVGMVVVRYALKAVVWVWRKVRSPARKFHRYQRR